MEIKRYTAGALYAEPRPGGIPVVLASDLEKVLEENKALQTKYDNATAAYADLWRNSTEEVRRLESELKDERAIVDRIWDQLGRPTYEQLKGRSIYDLVDELKAELKAAREELATAEKRAFNKWKLSRVLSFNDGYFTTHEIERVETDHDGIAIVINVTEKK